MINVRPRPHPLIATSLALLLTIVREPCVRALEHYALAGRRSNRTIAPARLHDAICLALLITVIREPCVRALELYELALPFDLEFAVLRVFILLLAFGPCRFLASASSNPLVAAQEQAGVYPPCPCRPPWLTYSQNRP